MAAVNGIADNKRTEAVPKGMANLYVGAAATGTIHMTAELLAGLRVAIAQTITTPVGQLSDPMLALLGLTVILVLLGLSAFFSSSEIAMFAFPDHRLPTVVDEELRGSKTLATLKDDPHRLLVTILVGNNLVNVAMSSVTTGLLAYFLASQSQAVLVTTFGITALILIFGESAPKSYAVDHTESWALRIARPLKFAEWLLYPLIVLFDYLTRVVNTVIGGDRPIESSYVTRDELHQLIETGEEEGVLEEDEREMLHRTLRFYRTIAKEAMTPRLDITGVQRDADVEAAIATAIETGHARLPVYEGTLDNVIGVVHVLDLLEETADGHDPPADLEALARPTLHVPETKPVSELLAELREQRLEMAIVIDEFGTTEGLVTIEDLTEEVVGEILEGGEEAPIERINEDTAIVKGEVNIDEVNDALEIDLPEGEEFETIAGFIFNRAGRLVDEGEKIAFDHLTLRVERVDNTRIKRARITGLEAYAAAQADAAAADEEEPE